MTREQEILKEAKAFADGQCEALIKPDDEYAFEQGARWADKHPHWTSVEEALPPRDTFFNISNIKNEDIEKYGLKDKELDSSIICLVVIRGGLRFANYNYEKKAWSTACCDDITHWMPVPQAPKEGGEV